MYNYYSQFNNMLPAQQVVTANGKESVDKLRMAPNSSVLVMDTTAPIIWLCISDGLGNVTSEPWDISPHKEEPQESEIEKRLAALEDQLKEALNGKSNDGGANVAKARPRKTGDGHDAESEHDA